MTPASCWYHTVRSCDEQWGHIGLRSSLFVHSITLASGARLTVAYRLIPRRPHSHRLYCTVIIAPAMVAGCTSHKYSQVPVTAGANLKVAPFPISPLSNAAPPAGTALEVAVC